MSVPAPPHSAGTHMPMKPSRPISASNARGISPAASQARACGATCSWAKARAASRIRVCSSLSSIAWDFPHFAQARYLFFDPHGETLIVMIGPKGRAAEIAKRLRPATIQAGRRTLSVFPERAGRAPHALNACGCTQGARVTLDRLIHGDPCDQLALLGEYLAYPVHHRAHTGSATQIAVDDHPVVGGELGDWRRQPLEQRMAVAD